jgi:hypothetical protein
MINSFFKGIGFYSVGVKIVKLKHFLYPQLKYHQHIAAFAEDYLLSIYSKINKMDSKILTLLVIGVTSYYPVIQNQ